jgi:hypothetical protein
MRVEPRFVRVTRSRCWFLRLPGLPNREPSPSASPSTACTGEVSDDRRARALGPSEGRVTERVSSESCRSNGCVALVAHADKRSPPRRPRDTPCHRRARSKGERPIPNVDEPAETAAPPPSREGRRHPDDQGAFHRSDGRRRSPGSLQVPSCVGLPLTPPTRSPRSVERCFFGHCKRSHARVTREEHSRGRAPL